MLATAVRTAAASLVASAVAVATIGAAPGIAEVPSSRVTTAPDAVIDPVLPIQLARGPSAALLSWNDELATRTEVAEYLSGNGIHARVLERLPVALVCAASTADLPTLTGAPGAVSVWGDHPLRPAQDHAVAAAEAQAANTQASLDVTGDRVGIAVVDTGVDGTHPDLEYGPKTMRNVRVVLSHMDLLGSNGDPCVSDQHTDQMADTELTSGHGTHLAGVAGGDGTASGGYYRGTAPAADIMGVGVADTITPQVTTDDQGPQLSLLGAIAGINYVLLRGVEEEIRVKVLLAGWTQDGLYDPWHPMGWAIRNAAEDGVTFVLPVGNDGGPASDCSSASTCSVNPWAADPRAIGVAALQPRSDRVLEDYSSRGDPQERQTRNVTVRYQPTLAAPGTAIGPRRLGVAPYARPPGSILGAGSDGTPVLFDRHYVGMAGTSVAAATVAGAIALMQEAAREATGCYLTSAQVKHILTVTATPTNYATWEAGAGALDVAAAVRAASEAAPVFSPYPWLCPGTEGY